VVGFRLLTAPLFSEVTLMLFDITDYYGLMLSTQKFLSGSYWIKTHFKVILLSRDFVSIGAPFNEMSLTEFYLYFSCLCRYFVCYPYVLLHSIHADSAVHPASSPVSSVGSVFGLERKDGVV
jgi:hypothetical protein